MEEFPAVLIDRDSAGVQSATLTQLKMDALMEGDVTVRVTHSTVNYKDGLAVTGRLPVVRRFPMIPGIDFAGEVTASDSIDFKIGDKVLLNGWGVGEVHFGGWAAFARVKSDWLIHQPQGLEAEECMAIGTAGYTAMLALEALEHHGLSPERGPAVVSGASGGVGSFAVMLLAQAGWYVFAITGRPEEKDYLKALGATEVLPRGSFLDAPKPLAKTRWAVGIDSVGGTMLSHLLSMTHAGGAIAACGNAGGMDFPGSVAPFILRGISLLGIDSVMVPRVRRESAWARLAREINRTRLKEIRTSVPLSEAVATARAIVDGKIRGRVVVQVE